MVYVIGTTKSSDFPVTGNAYQPVQWGPSDAFIAKLDPVAGAVAVFDVSGRRGAGRRTRDSGRRERARLLRGVDAVGQLPDGGLPVFGGRIGAEDVVFGVMDLTKAGPPSLVYSTFFGGTGNEEVRGMAFDAKGNVIVTGYTLSTDLPVTADAMQASREAMATLLSRYSIRL